MATLQSTPRLAEQAWPSFAWTGDWPATADYVHLLVQMLGKLRLALAPAQPEWFHAALALTPRGVTTGIMRHFSGALEAELDIQTGYLRLSVAGGDRREVAISPALPIAQIWRAYSRALTDLGVVVKLWDKPQERSDATPFGDDERPRNYDPGLAVGWLRVLHQVHALLDESRSAFFGRSGVNFWWGAFDLTLGIFSGRKATPPPTANFIMRYDLDAEQMVVGFWPGDAQHEGFFYGYIVPEPPGCGLYDLSHAGASWAPSMGEWTLPYERIRTDPERVDRVRTFIDAIFRATHELAGWDTRDFTYVLPNAAPEPSGRAARHNRHSSETRR